MQAPEHVVENEKALAKAGDDPRLRRKVVRKKPPERFVSWGQPTFERLVAASPEPLTSSFKVTHAMVLNVIARPGDAFAAMRHLLTDNDEDRPAQRRHIHQAIAIYRALLAGGVVEVLPAPDDLGRMVRLTVDLQFDFALNQPLSPFALAAISLLDRSDPSYPLDVVSVIEATLDDPRQVLSAAQQFRARGEAVAQMKADGVGVSNGGSSCWTRLPIPSRFRSCSTGRTRYTGAVILGSRTMSCRRRAWLGICMSGR